MEHYDVKLMSRAMQDMEDIYAYIAQTLREPETALALAGRLETAILSLERMPYRCPERRRGAYAGRGYRQLFVGNYTIIYRVDEPSRTVLVVTVRYAPSEF